MKTRKLKKGKICMTREVKTKQNMREKQKKKEIREKNMHENRRKAEKYACKQEKNEKFA